jgi:hypothetical protein
MAFFATASALTQLINCEKLLATPAAVKRGQDPADARIVIDLSSTLLVGVRHKLTLLVNYIQGDA